MTRMVSPPPRPPSSDLTNSFSNSPHDISTSCINAPRSLGTDVPRHRSSCSSAAAAPSIVSRTRGTRRRIESPRIPVNISVKTPVPQLTIEYLSRFASKNARSLARAADMSTSALMSNCDRLTTAHHPSLSRTARPASTSDASVPRSIRSSFVSTPTVRTKPGSTSLATRMPSDVAMSAFAGDTATTMTSGGVTNFFTMASMSRTTDAG
mmetsp:Transcript_3250/g.13237  ORF Transcript_3250/g.13237 Transcript_3250/m.13237 type:complete len:209 (-) Transcript_3250:801-1427(-)